VVGSVEANRGPFAGFLKAVPECVVGKWLSAFAADQRQTCHLVLCACYFARPHRNAIRDGKLPAQTLRSMVPPSQIGFQSKWRQKRRAFGISTAPWCRARSRLTTRKASKKWWLN